MYQNVTFIIGNVCLSVDNHGVLEARDLNASFARDLNFEKF